MRADFELRDELRRLEGLSLLEIAGRVLDLKDEVQSRDMEIAELYEEIHDLRDGVTHP